MGLTIENFIEHVEGDSKDSRNADSAVKGYLYQFELTLLHILKDKDKAIKPIYILEKIEDYMKYFEHGGKLYIEVAQIKNHTSKVNKSTYYKAILWMYYDFLRSKLMDKQNFEFKVVLYHSDEKASTFKILDVLNDAMNSNARKKKPLDVYLKIMGLGNESNAVRMEFSNCSRFYKSNNRSDVISEIEEELFKLYGDKRNEYSNKNLLYAYAISKIMDHILRGKEPISFDILDDYMCSEQLTFNEAFIIKQIEQKVLDLIGEEVRMLDEAKESSDDSFGISTKTHKEYKEIYELIFSFISEKIANPTYRKSFLNTVTTGTLQEYLTSTEQEFKIFLERGDYIRSFIVCLAKIMYQYHKTKRRKVKIKHLDEWFEINEFVWIFKHPYEKRDSGYLIGNFNVRGTEHSLINSVLQRLEELPIKPNVWYWKSPSGINASQKRPYKHDPMKVDPKGSPGEEYFYIQCLGCLELDKFDSIDKVENIFNLGCVEGMGK